MMSKLYDKIGIGYNETRRADSYLSSRLFHHLALSSDSICLDIGCGTGNYTTAIQKLGIQVIGVDPSAKMLEKARKRSPQSEWLQANAENTTVSTNSAAGLIAFLTIHHWQDLSSAFNEMKRILKPGGKMVIFTSTPAQMKGYWLCHYFPKMMADSIKQMSSLNQLTIVLENSYLRISHFEPYSVQPDLQDHFLYCGKHNPEMYFTPEIRRGISSFSALAHLDEINIGLTNLRTDIDSGKIQNVIRDYDNSNGDYLFIVVTHI